jgi:hypothetical protein
VRPVSLVGGRSLRRALQVNASVSRANPGMSSTKQGIGLADHAVGALCSAAVLAFTPQLFDAVSWALSSLTHRSDGSFALMGPIEFGPNPPLLALAVWLGFIGLLAAAFDHLVQQRRLRAWFPPLAVLGLATTGFITLIATLGKRDQRGSFLAGASIGAVVGLGFATWWFAALAASFLRSRHKQRAG